MVINISIKLIYIMLNDDEEYLSISVLDEILQSFSDLQYNPRQLLKKYLSQALIKTGFIREILIEEGVSSKKAFLILEGTAMITKKVANGKMVFAQLESLQLVNLQVLIYKRAHYTATVKSSKMKYIQIVQPIIGIVYDSLKDSLVLREKKRKTEIENKLKEVSQIESRKQMQQMVDRLSLPALKYFGRQSTQEWKKPKPTLEEKGQKQKKPHILQKQQSEILIRKQRGQKKSLELRPIQTIMRGQSKISGLGKTGIDRNEKIFKEQLKTIIRRKLIYERKQLGVMQAYRQNHNNDKSVIYEQSQPYTQPRENQIDQYFKF